MSCLGKAGCAVVLVAVGAAAVVGWQQRDRIAEKLGWKRPEAEVVRTGRPSPEGLTRAVDKVDSLAGWRADSVVLTPAEVASLAAEGLAGTKLGRPESLEVELGDNNVAVRGIMKTEWIPRDLLGPLGGVIGEQQRVELGGPLFFRRPGRGGWQVNRVKVGDLRLPVGLVHRFIEAAIPGSRSAGIGVDLPEGVGGLAVRPGALVLYGTEQAGSGTTGSGKATR